MIWMPPEAVQIHGLRPMNELKSLRNPTTTDPSSDVLKTCGAAVAENVPSVVVVPPPSGVQRFSWRVPMPNTALPSPAIVSGTNDIGVTVMAACAAVDITANSAHADQKIDRSCITLLRRWDADL